MLDTVRREVNNLFTLNRISTHDLCTVVPCSTSHWAIKESHFLSLYISYRRCGCKVTTLGKKHYF